MLRKQRSACNLQVASSIAEKYKPRSQGTTTAHDDQSRQVRRSKSRNDLRNDARPGTTPPLPPVPSLPIAYRSTNRDHQQEESDRPRSRSTEHTTTEQQQQPPPRPQQPPPRQQQHPRRQPQPQPPLHVESVPRQPELVDWHPRFLDRVPILSPVEHKHDESDPPDALVQACVQSATDLSRLPFLPSSFMPDIYFPVNQFALTDQAIDTRVMLVPDVFTRTFASTDRWPQDVMMVGKQRPFPPPQDELKWRKLPDVFSRDYDVGARSKGTKMIVTFYTPTPDPHNAATHVYVSPGPKVQTHLLGEAALLYREFESLFDLQDRYMEGKLTRRTERSHPCEPVIHRPQQTVDLYDKQLYPNGMGNLQDDGRPVDRSFQRVISECTNAFNTHSDNSPMDAREMYAKYRAVMHLPNPGCPTIHHDHLPDDGEILEDMQFVSAVLGGIGCKFTFDLVQATDGHPGVTASIHTSWQFGEIHRARLIKMARLTYQAVRPALLIPYIVQTHSQELDVEPQSNRKTSGTSIQTSWTSSMLPRANYIGYNLDVFDIGTARWSKDIQEQREREAFEARERERGVTVTPKRSLQSPPPAYHSLIPNIPMIPPSSPRFNRWTSDRKKEEMRRRLRADREDIVPGG